MQIHITNRLRKSLVLNWKLINKPSIIYKSLQTQVTLESCKLVTILFNNPNNRFNEYFWNEDLRQWKCYSDTRQTCLRVLGTAQNCTFRLIGSSKSQCIAFLVSVALALQHFPGTAPFQSNSILDPQMASIERKLYQPTCNWLKFSSLRRISVNPMGTFPLSPPCFCQTLISNDLLSTKEPSYLIFCLNTGDCHGWTSLVFLLLLLFLPLRYIFT